MKKFYFLILFCGFAPLLQAQAFLTGKLSDSTSTVRDILYDRTQEALAPDVFQTTYKIFDLKKKMLYTILITHDRITPSVAMSTKREGSLSLGMNIPYERNNSGLIFCDKGNRIGSFDIAEPYLYLFSFTDTSRDYPVLHKIATTDNKELELDPLNNLRVRRHNEAVKNLPPDPRNAPPVKPLENNSPKKSFNAELLEMHDSLYFVNLSLTVAVSAIHDSINTAMDSLFKDKREEDNSGYEGDRRGGKPDGNGMLVGRGNVFYGNFVKGKFKTGVVILHNKIYEYNGEYSNDTFNGLGWLKYKNGNCLLGNFVNGTLVDGVGLWKDRNNEIYFGNYKFGQQNGYGELRNGETARYYGEFMNARLIHGYSKEQDPFGNAVYARYDNGNKGMVDAKEPEDFFDSILNRKK